MADTETKELPETQEGEEKREPLKLSAGAEDLKLVTFVPADPPEGLAPGVLIELMRRDKKAVGGEIKLVLPENAIGRVRLMGAGEEAILAVL